MRTVPLLLLLLPAAAMTAPLAAQIQRHPTGVNVNATGPTTVFITFGNLDGYVPVEAVWCGELTSAAPALGDRCDAGTIFGVLPIRLDQSRFSGQDGFSDLMSIPASVARRARQAAVGGAESAFFYVRRFVDPTGGRPDQFVSVTCRMAGDGARTPLALLDVELRFTGEDPVPGVPGGSPPPPFQARIAYNGTGRLVGRWEVVLPGEDPPERDDLLTEASLPAELRGTRRRYTELERFNLFLPPTGTVILPGPSSDRLPTALSGLYQVLLRIEASDDKEGDTDLAAAGAGVGIVPTGAVAGFALPFLRYFVGTGGPASPAETRLHLLEPAPDARILRTQRLVFNWTALPSAALYRLEVRDVDGREVLRAVVQAGTAWYAAPPFVVADHAGQVLEWRVVVLNAEGAVIETAPWQRLEIEG